MMKHFAVFAAIALGLAGGSTASADVPDAELVRCAGEIDDAARLACYDALAGSISAEARKLAETRKAAAAERAAKEAAEKAAAAERAFGAEQAGLPREDGRIDDLTAKVTELYQDKYGMYLLMLDNGQFWKQLDGKLLIMREATRCRSSARRSAAIA